MFEHGSKVRDRGSGKIKEVFIPEKGKSITDHVKDGSFNKKKHIDYNFLMLNRGRYNKL